MAAVWVSSLGGIFIGEEGSEQCGTDGDTFSHLTALQWGVFWCFSLQSGVFSSSQWGFVFSFSVGSIFFSVSGSFFSVGIFFLVAGSFFFFVCGSFSQWGVFSLLFVGVFSQWGVEWGEAAAAIGQKKVHQACPPSAAVQH